MNSDSGKSFYMGCATAALVVLVSVFLLLILFGMMIRGCVNAESSQEISDSLMKELDPSAAKPEEMGTYTKVWVTGDAAGGAAKVLRIKLRGVISDMEDRNILEFEEGNTAPSALRKIRTARRDKSIRGLWLDIDSPGGSVTMSDRLHDAVMCFKASSTNRFVFVHMGDLCCSGGYYVAAPADMIMARPTTLTGSIGVIMNSLNAAELAQKVGVASISIASATNKDLLNPLKPVDPAHVAILKRPITQMYDRFVGIVAQGRHLSVEKVRTLADGRVFSAEDAVKEQLVDCLGHDDAALAAVRKLAGGGKVHVLRYRERPRLEKLLLSSLFFENVGDLVRQFKASLDAESAPKAEYRLR